MGNTPTFAYFLKQPSATDSTESPISLLRFHFYEDVDNFTCITFFTINLYRKQHCMHHIQCYGDLLHMIVALAGVYGLLGVRNLSYEVIV